jgi:hypothetical protein
MNNAPRHHGLCAGDDDFDQHSPDRDGRDKASHDKRLPEVVFADRSEA